MIDAPKLNVCENCPRVMHEKATIERATIAKAAIEQGAIQNGFDACAVVLKLRGVLPEGYSSEDAAALMRKTAARDLNVLDEVITDSMDALEELTTTCHRPLRMQAGRAGVQYLVTLCTSDTLSRNVIEDDDVHTVRTPIQE